MSTYKEDYTVDSLISTLSAFMANHWENARESYYKEGSQAFNALMSETVRPTEILCELIKSRESTDEQFREAAVLRAQKELGKEMQKRIEKSLIKRKVVHELIRPDITPQEFLVVLETNIDKTQKLLSYFPKNSAQYDEIYDYSHTIMLACAELETALDRSDENYINFIFEVVKKDVHDELLKRLAELEMIQKVELDGGRRA